MRKVVFGMMTTLNGRVDDPDAWASEIGEELYIEIDQAYSTFDTVLIGRTTYEEMFAYWPGTETEEGGSEISKRMAHKMNTYRKYVFSGANEKRTLEWNNAEQVLAHSDEGIRSFIMNLKAQSGGDIHLAGGAQIVQTIVRLGLVDEYHFYVHPVVSDGATWFGQLKDKLDLELISATPYPGGVVGMYYRPRSG